MIVLHQAPEIEATDEQWALVLYAGRPFDFGTPFRAVLQEIVARLATSAACDLHLPAYQEREDFVDGTLRWGSHSFDIYYEYSLGYLSVASRDKAAVDDLWRNASSLFAFAQP